MEKTLDNKHFDQIFGQFVRKKRIEFGWSQEELATKIGNNYQNISRLERGEISPTLFWCSKLASVFEMPLYVLIKEFDS